MSSCREADTSTERIKRPERSQTLYVIRTDGLVAVQGNQVLKYKSSMQETFTTVEKQFNCLVQRQFCRL
jgi:hypothetical protein